MSRNIHLEAIGNQLKTVFALDIRKASPAVIESEVRLILDYLREMGFDVHYPRSVDYNSKFTSTLGRVTRYRSGIYYRMAFCQKYFEVGDNINLHSTIAHECIHCVEGCFDHGEKFKRIALILNATFGLTISRTTTDVNYAACRVERSAKVEYVCKCTNCGPLCTRKKMCNLVRGVKENPNRYRCPICGKTGTIIVEVKNV